MSHFQQTLVFWWVSIGRQLLPFSSHAFLGQDLYTATNGPLDY
jgi:hypothetical protein